MAFLLLSFLLLLSAGFKCGAVLECPNCPPQWISTIRGIVSRATYVEPRNVHFSFYSDWISDVSKPDTNAHIEYLTPADISGYRASAVSGKRDVDYRIIYLFQALTTSDQSEKPFYNGSVDLAWMSGLASDVDNFLMLNPCWLPLLEPCVYNCSRLHQQVSRRGSPDARPSYGNSVVLLMLPSDGFHDTCVLYEYLARRQFPEVCIYDSNNMTSVALHNIGWSHTLHSMVHVMMNTLMPGHDHKVFVAPFAEQFYARDQMFYLPNGTLHERKSTGWQWANPATCPVELYLFNPWACNFLSISNCSTRESVFDIPEDSKGRIWEGDFTYLQKRLGITRESRKVHHDASKADDNAWIDQRLISFVTRPNARMRQMVRKSLRSIRPIESHMHIPSLNGPPASSSDISTFANAKAISGNHYKSPHFLNHHSRTSTVLQLPGPPCIAVHIRHGDSIYDMRINNKTDRSIHAHVHNLKELSEMFGTNVVFLMTDNATLPQYVAGRFPEYNWVMQSRPISKSIRMYSAANEEDIQLELAHILADILHSGSCIAVVGCFDSGIAAQVSRSIGDRTKTGATHRIQSSDVLDNVVRGWTPVVDLP